MTAACAQMSRDVEGLGPCEREAGHPGMHKAGRTSWGSPAPGECWCCENADEAWHCSVCGGHGDDGRVPVVARCPGCDARAKVRFRDLMTGNLMCARCELDIELVDPEHVHAKLKLPEVAR